MSPIKAFNELCLEQGITPLATYPVKKHNVRGEINDVPGIYILKHRDGTWYVGKSVNMSTRLSQAHKHRGSGWFESGAAIALPLDRTQLLAFEQLLIRKCKPDLNIMFT